MASMRAHEWQILGPGVARVEGGPPYTKSVMLEPGAVGFFDLENVFAAEILRLAEEVERLKAENHGLRLDMDTRDEQEFADGEAEEGARIRRELHEWADEQDWLVGEEEDAFYAALDRIMPGEG